MTYRDEQFLPDPVLSSSIICSPVFESPESIDGHHFPNSHPWWQSFINVRPRKGEGENSKQGLGTVLHKWQRVALQEMAAGGSSKWLFSVNLGILIAVVKCVVNPLRLESEEEEAEEIEETFKMTATEIAATHLARFAKR